MSEGMTIKETPGKPPEPTREEMIFARDRYESRIPAQDFRIAKAKAALSKAEKDMAIIRKEFDEAIEARERLNTYIADLTAKIGA